MDFLAWIICENLPDPLVGRTERLSADTVVVAVVAVNLPPAKVSHPAVNLSGMIRADENSSMLYDGGDAPRHFHCIPLVSLLAPPLTSKF